MVGKFCLSFCWSFGKDPVLKLASNELLGTLVFIFQLMDCHGYRGWTLSLCWQYSKVLFMIQIFTRQWTILWKLDIVWFLMLDVHYNLLQKTFTHECVLCDLLHFLYYKLYVTVHFWYILSTCINMLAHNISLYIYQWNLGWVLFEVNSSMNKTIRSWYILTFLNIFLATSWLNTKSVLLKE